MSRRITFFVGIALSALFLYLAVRGARLSEMAAVLARANYWYMIPCVAFTLLAYGFRSLRWRYLLHSVRPIPMGTLFSATIIGFLANNVLPARLGELVRAHVVGRRAGISRSAALASIVIERIFDLFTLLALFGVVSFVSPYPGVVGEAALIVFGIGCAALIALILWNRHPDRFVRVLMRFIPSRGRDRAAGLADGFREGLGVFDKGAHLWMVGFVSILHWASIIIVTWLCIRSLGIAAPQPQASLVALVAIALITMVPSAPGFVGTLQGAGTAALLVFGVPKEQGLAFSILYHATQWLPVNIVGAYFLVREGMSLGQLSRLAAPKPARE
jgi:hypothetical protein